MESTFKIGAQVIRKDGQGGPGTVIQVFKYPESTILEVLPRGPNSQRRLISADEMIPFRVESAAKPKEIEPPEFKFGELVAFSGAKNRSEGWRVKCCEHLRAWLAEEATWHYAVERGEEWLIVPEYALKRGADFEVGGQVKLVGAEKDYVPGELLAMVTDSKDRQLCVVEWQADYGNRPVHVVEKHRLELV